MTAPLKTYRVCCFDGVRKIVTADLIEAGSDEAAIAKAEAQGFGSKCEIWDGGRLVATLERDGRTA